MAKEKKAQEFEASESSQEMSLEEARAYRASLYKPSAPDMSEEERREAFRIFWAGNKAKYGKSKSIEKALWLHLKTIGMDSPDKFLEGCKHFGLTKAE